MFGLLAFSVWLATASAASLAGVSMPDSVTVGGQNLVLNGMGLREKYTIDVYVGGLYLPSKTTSSSSAISMDTPKRLTMHFVYSSVPKDKLAESFYEGLEKNPAGGAQKAKMDQLVSMLEDVHSGDEVVFDYVPGQGTAVRVRGRDKGVVQGADFMKALWTVYLGSDPPTAKLKSGMMGQ